MKAKALIFSLLTVASLASCSQKSTLPYFQDISAVEGGKLPDLAFPDPVIMPDDELSIVVTSANPLATTEYNAPSTNPNMRTTFGVTSPVKEQTYVVSKQGTIDFPSLGTIEVKGMTLDQLKNYLTEKISAEVADPRVEVRLVNFVVNVGGEVAHPGRFEVTRNRLSIIDALLMAGDLSAYGRRDNVLIVREGVNGREFAHLNLESSDILSSPYYYLQPNDYIYVEPNSVRQANARYDQQKSYNLQVTSTIVSAASVIASLVIALTIK